MISTSQQVSMQQDAEDFWGSIETGALDYSELMGHTSQQDHLSPRSSEELSMPRQHGLVHHQNSRDGISYAGEAGNPSGFALLCGDCTVASDGGVHHEIQQQELHSVVFGQETSEAHLPSRQHQLCRIPSMGHIPQQDPALPRLGEDVSMPRQHSLVHHQNSHDGISNAVEAGRSSGFALLFGDGAVASDRSVHHEIPQLKHHSVVFSHETSEAHVPSHEHQQCRMPSRLCPRESQSGHHRPNAQSLNNRTGPTAGQFADGGLVGSVEVEDTEHFRKEVERLRKVKHAHSCHVLQLREQHRNLVTKLSHCKNLYELARRDFRGNGGIEADRLEVDNLHQKLDAVMLLKGMLFKDNMELQRELETLRRSAGEGVKLSACVICMDNLANVVCMPCKHLVLCAHCSQQENVHDCPICRTHVQEKMQIYTP